MEIQLSKNDKKNIHKSMIFLKKKQNYINLFEVPIKQRFAVSPAAPRCPVLL